MTQRRIEAILAAPRAHWAADGFLVQRYIWRSPELVRQASPFLLMDHHAPFLYPPTTFVRGLPFHPHRGIATVTFVFAGRLTHRDRSGAGGIIGPGDVQWTTAGSGIVHHESHEATFARAGGTLHMLQVWINLPAALKMCAPREQHLSAHAIPAVPLARQGGSEGASHRDGGAEGGFVRIIAGTFASVRGPAETHVPVEIFDVALNHGARIPLEIDATHNVMLLVIGGSVRIDPVHSASCGQFVRFRREPGTIEIEALAPATRVIVVAGAPIDEPLVLDGPFVMNDAAQIRQAYADFKDVRVGAPERSDA